MLETPRQKAPPIPDSERSDSKSDDVSLDGGRDWVEDYRRDATRHDPTSLRSEAAGNFKARSATRDEENKPRSISPSPGLPFRGRRQDSQDHRERNFVQMTDEDVQDVQSKLNQQGASSSVVTFEDGSRGVLIGTHAGPCVGIDKVGDLDRALELVSLIEEEPAIERIRRDVGLRIDGVRRS